jgi:acetyl-CoA carboxylase biotin carboxyl carrier protein
MVEVLAPMPANVIEIVVEAGESVDAEQDLIILESMKMEVPVTAPTAGKVTEILAKAGEPVAEGQLLLRIEPA